MAERVQEAGQQRKGKTPTLVVRMYGNIFEVRSKLTIAYSPSKADELIIRPRQ